MAAPVAAIWCFIQEFMRGSWAMRLFSCPACRQRLYFENSVCLACGTPVVYDPRRAVFEPVGDARPRCANATDAGCNWMAGDGIYCIACTLNQTIPDLSVPGNAERWRDVEAAKRRMVYSLLAFGLEVRPKAFPGEEAGIAFDFLADQPGGGPGGERILTGHDNGLITLNVAEADPHRREKMRVEMGESYRTLLGHFRHEIGHYYWDRLIGENSDRLERFRAAFGDERLDYAEALRTHYADGPSAGWEENHISHYAASHPWEDWAETWAHYLHIVDTLEMAEAYRVPLDRLGPDGAPLAGGEDLFEAMSARWLVLSDAVNSINRCMGLPDLYPFVISPAVAAKLRFVGEVLEEARREN